MTRARSWSFSLSGEEVTVTGARISSGIGRTQGCARWGAGVIGEDGGDDTRWLFPFWDAVTSTEGAGAGAIAACWAALRAARLLFKRLIWIPIAWKALLTPLVTSAMERSMSKISAISSQAINQIKAPGAPNQRVSVVRRKLPIAPPPIWSWAGSLLASSWNHANRLNRKSTIPISRAGAILEKFSRFLRSKSQTLPKISKNGKRYAPQPIPLYNTPAHQFGKVPALEVNKLINVRMAMTRRIIPKILYFWSWVSLKTGCEVVAFFGVGLREVLWEVFAGVDLCVDERLEDPVPLLVVFLLVLLVDLARPAISSPPNEMCNRIIAWRLLDAAELLKR